MKLEGGNIAMGGSVPTGVTSSSTNVQTYNSPNKNGRMLQSRIQGTKDGLML